MIKGLLKSSIETTIGTVLEAELMYGGRASSGGISHSIGKADVKREGSDVTLVTFQPLRLVEQAARQRRKKGGSGDHRPSYNKALGREQFINRSEANRCIVDETWPFASVASHIGWLVSKNCFDYLDAPVELVTSEDVPMPYNHTLELEVQPTVKKIVAAAKSVLYI